MRTSATFTRLAAALLLGAAARAGEVKFGQFQREITGLSEPGAAAVDAAGNIWVTERFSGRVRAFDPAGLEVDGFGLEALPGLPREPRGLAIGPAGEVYASDGVEQVVIVLDATGGNLRRIGRRGAGPGELREPRGIALVGGKLYVTDAGNHRVSVFGTDGKFERSIGRRGRGDGELLAPADVAVDEQGRVFVADLGNQRVVRFEADGSFARAWGGLGPYSGLFHAPSGIAVRGGHVFVADRDNHRVQVFDVEGQPVHEWGLHAVRPREGAGKLHYPSGIALSPAGDVALVVEGLEGRVQVFVAQDDLAADPPIVDRTSAAHYQGGCDVAGDLLAVVEPALPSVSIFDLTTGSAIEITRFGRSGATPGKLLAPADVEFDADGESVWVADPLANRIAQYSVRRTPGAALRFEPFLARFVREVDLSALPGVPATPWPTEPAALELTPQHEMLVADRANGRVLVLDRAFAFARSLGEVGTGPGHLLDPVAIAVADDAQTVFVADARGRKIQAFRRDGTPAGEWPLPRAEGGAGARPRGLALANQGGLWASAEDEHVLARFDAEGVWQSTIGTPGRAGLGRLEFFHPEGLARTPDGGVVAIDAGNHRFQILAPDGTFRTAWGSRLFLEPALRPR